MSALSQATPAQIGKRRSAGRHRAQKVRKIDDLARFEIQAEQRYRTMTGMDEPLEARAARARKIAAKIEPLAAKTW